MLMRPTPIIKHGPKHKSDANHQISPKTTNQIRKILLQRSTNYFINNKVFFSRRQGTAALLWSDFLTNTQFSLKLTVFLTGYELLRIVNLMVDFTFTLDWNIFLRKETDIFRLILKRWKTRTSHYSAVTGHGGHSRDIRKVENGRLMLYLPDAFLAS